MSDETNQVKHPFRFVKPKNKDTEAIMNSKRCQAIESFKECIDYATKDKENCFSKEHKRTIKSCNCILSVKYDDNVPKLCTLIGDLCLSTSEFKNHYFKEVIGAGFAASSFIKCHNPRTYRPLASEPDFALCKHALRLLLDIGLRKFKGIVKNYGIAVRLEHGAKGIACDRLGIKELKSQAINFITELAETEGETHATRFMREEHKLFIRDAELNTIELPSHYTKRRI